MFKSSTQYKTTTLLWFSFVVKLGLVQLATLDQQSPSSLLNRRLFPSIVGRHLQPQYYCACPGTKPTVRNPAPLLNPGVIPYLIYLFQSVSRSVPYLATALVEERFVITLTMTLLWYYVFDDNDATEVDFIRFRVPQYSYSFFV